MLAVVLSLRKWRVVDVKAVSKILVNLDPDTDVQPALDKAIYLARSYRAEVHLLLVAYNRSLITNHFFSQKQLKTNIETYVKSLGRWVRSYVNDVENEDIKCTYQVVWHKPLYEAILQQAEEINADLVMKSTHHHASINKVLFTPNDWQLLNNCPVPLILAKSKTRNQYENIQAAVDPSDDAVETARLNQQILCASQNICEKLQAKAHAIHCYDPIGYQLWSDIGLGMGVGMGPTDFGMGEESYQEYINHFKITIEKKFKDTLANYNIDDDNLHLIEGYPEQILPKAVDKFDIDLLVLGASHHFALIGSTAEKILDYLHCDILSIRNWPESIADSEAS